METHCYTAHWYVIQTVGGQESKVVESIAQATNNNASTFSVSSASSASSARSLISELFIPRYQIKKRYNGIWQLRDEILLPGYVFVVTKDPEALQQILLNIPSFAKLLRTENSFARLDDSEIQFINAFTQPNHRIIEMSEGVIEGDRIVILNGPLMGQTGLIKRIDRHKRLAYLEIEMLGRQLEIKVGLEITRKS